ncbi:hypothetical protein THIOM_003850 [Candidatus Thiomargarita nelsonii]|uniref:Uncharacterized protein n=1 Tax=Candidatus Thiomargarita nelsonii TaxID=1003181 RepID=A0A176RXK9_9GAMM|nr:hypothetical protein THIOM_003850 [Candidatus Thiomargarita nelsonii]
MRWERECVTSELSELVKHLRTAFKGLTKKRCSTNPIYNGRCRKPCVTRIRFNGELVLYYFQ